MSYNILDIAIPMCVKIDGEKPRCIPVTYSTLVKGTVVPNS